MHNFVIFYFRTASNNRMFTILCCIGFDRKRVYSFSVAAFTLTRLWPNLCFMLYLFTLYVRSLFQSVLDILFLILIVFASCNVCISITKFDSINFKSCVFSLLLIAMFIKGSCDKNKIICCWHNLKFMIWSGFVSQ
jgi:hypothetical protein